MPEQATPINISNLILNGGAVAILGWLVVVGMPKLAERIDNLAAIEQELRRDMDEAKIWRNFNDPGAARKARAEVSHE